MVARNEDDLLLTLGHDREFRRPDRIGHRIVDQFHGALGRHIVVHLGDKRTGITVFRNVQGEKLFAIGEFYYRHGRYSFR